MSGVEVIRSAALADVAHGFLGRRGGVTTGVTAGLDMGRRGDAVTAEYAENRRRAIAAVAPGATLMTLHQTHSSDCVTVVDRYDDDFRPRADALVTDVPGLALGILTADCAPVLFADPAAGVVGAAHAGWRGALGGVTDTTLLAMEALGAERGRIAAVIGPCIAQASYEVDDAFRRRFEEDAPGNARFFVPAGPGHARFHLAGYVAARLRAAGVGRVEDTALDTAADPDRFYSYRRATQAGAPDYGRQISIIAAGSFPS